MALQLESQNWCKKEYKKINDLQEQSYNVLKDNNKSLFKRIRKSKKLAKQALKFAYATIEENDCQNYSLIVDKMIEIELQLGNKKRAEKIALKRLNKKTPGWKSVKGRANFSDLAVLASISNYKKSDSFYRNFRKDKRIQGVCGTTTYDEAVSLLLSQAKLLYNNYGKIYCLKLLQGSTIIINEDIESTKPYWDEIYDLLIKSMHAEYTYEQIKNQYEASVIQKKNCYRIGKN